MEVGYRGDNTGSSSHGASHQDINKGNGWKTLLDFPRVRITYRRVGVNTNGLLISLPARTMLQGRRKVFLENCVVITRLRPRLM